MTAPTLPDLSTLDRSITAALAALRHARASTIRYGDADAVRAERDAESRLNGLLECRLAAQRQ
ncbi:hypothetical protein [Geodermatophilus sp. SYSU D00766]